MRGFLKYGTIFCGFAVPAILLVAFQAAGRDWVYGLIPGVLLWMLIEILTLNGLVQSGALSSRTLHGHNIGADTEVINDCVLRLSKSRDPFSQDAAVDVLKRAAHDLQSIANGVVPVPGGADLATVPVSLAQTVKRTLDATLVWREDTLRGNLGREYAAKYEESVKSRRIRVRRIYVFESLDALPAEALDRIEREAEWGVQSRMMTAAAWEGVGDQLSGQPIDFGIWDSETVWQYGPLVAGRREAWLRLGAANIQPYIKMFEANWLVSTSPNARAPDAHRLDTTNTA